jgi:hypothetical protein
LGLPSAKLKTEAKQVEELSVKSKIIKSVYFSQEGGRLRICFRNGEERLFEGVPSSEAHAMTAAPSPGHDYLDRIRTRFRRLRPEQSRMSQPTCRIVWDRHRSGGY